MEDGLGKSNKAMPKKHRPKVWKLLNDEVKAKFFEKMEVFYPKSDERNAWLKYKTSALKTAEEVCGVRGGRPQHGEAWWRNHHVQKAITEKRKCFRRRKQLLWAENKPAMFLIKRKLLLICCCCCLALLQGVSVFGSW